MAYTSMFMRAWCIVSSVMSSAYSRNSTLAVEYVDLLTYMHSSKGVLHASSTMDQKALISSSNRVVLQSTMLCLSNDVESCLLGSSCRSGLLSTFSLSKLTTPWWTRVGTAMTQEDAQDP